jgi:DNA-binding response OmpR family regulator
LAHSVLRRRDSRRQGRRRVGEIFIDPSWRQVRIGDRPIKLANKEFAWIWLVQGIAGQGGN